jgi:hypothetical protein
MDQPPVEPEPPAFRMPQGPPPEVEARSARPEPEPAITEDPAQRPLEPR